jgi:hypothetical protein
MASSSSKYADVRLVDCTIFNGDPIIELRIPYLFDSVDRFVIVEARETHSGVRKNGLFVDKYAKFLEPYMSKISIVIIEEFPTSDPNAINFDGIDRVAWTREHYQRDMAHTFVRDMYKEQPFMLLCCDMDEIPRKEVVACMREHYPLEDAIHLEMAVFHYSFRWMRKGHVWAHPFVVNDRVAALHSLSRFRTGMPRHLAIPNGGWHMSYAFTVGGLVRKMEAFAHSEFNREELKGREFIKACMLTGRFYLNPSGEPLTAADGEDLRDLPDGWKEFQDKLDEAIFKEDRAFYEKTDIVVDVV